MVLTKIEIQNLIREWLIEWDKYNLEGVLEIMHEDVIFENWTGVIICGKKKLRRSWGLWFKNHEHFKFSEEDLFVDEQEQKVLFQWELDWMSLEDKYKGHKEIRKGVDVIHFLDGKITRKSSYSKTTIQIDGNSLALTT
jgi:ketosteroid isomerase-like protein